MQIEIQTRDFSLTPALRNYINRRLHFALGIRDNHIQRVIVRLSDINGPRGGADKRCHIQVALAHVTDVIIEDIETDLYVAIDHATERAGCTVGRRLERQRVKSRSRSRVDIELLIENNDDAIEARRDLEY